MSMDLYHLSCSFSSSSSCCPPPPPTRRHHPHSRSTAREQPTGGRLTHLTTQMKNMKQGLLLAVLLHVLSLTECLSLGPRVQIRSAYKSRNQRHVLDRTLNALEQQGFPGMANCPFDAYENSKAVAGDVFDRYSMNNESDCKAACLRQTNFYCAASLIRSHTCYLTGFRMRRDYWSTHYVRTCDDTSNVACYKPMAGWSVVHSKDYAVPWFMNRRETRLYFCMALCNESLDCVGFDLKDHGRRPMCHLSKLVTIDETLRFDVHLRRC